MRKLVAAVGLSVLLAAALVASGCGSSKKGGAGKKGGEITILEAAGGVDSLDPGYWYYQTDYEDLAQTTQRQLYGWPAAANNPATASEKIKYRFMCEPPCSVQERSLIERESISMRPV